MRIRDLVKRSLSYYWRSNLAVVAGVATAVSVLAGALLVGNSVRSSLLQLVVNRLGATDEVISAPGFFRGDLASSLARSSQFGRTFRASEPLIQLEGVTTLDKNKSRAGGVNVYGITDTFFTFHGVTGTRTLEGDEVLVSQGLAQELGASPGDDILIRIEKPSPIPSESLHGRKEDAGVTLRSTIRDVLPADSIGEFALKPQQAAVKAVFLPLQRLQRNLEQDGKVNMLLLARSDARQSAELAVRTAQSALRENLTLEDLGLRVRLLEEKRTILVESASAVISNEIADRVQKAATATQLRSSPILTYLANTMRLGNRSIPYSLITAVNRESYDKLKHDTTIGVSPPLVLNDWAASDLAARPGDAVTIEYYVWRDEGRIDTSSAEFRVDRVIPLDGAAKDSDYAPEYPGITEALSLADWDPPFPVDLQLVRPKDEEYWDKFKTTPKAFILLEDGERLWKTRYGSLTSVRLYPRDGVDLRSAYESFVREFRALLDPMEAGFAVHSPREQGQAAARGATDFGEYFTYFSFFIVVSALFLAALFFRLGIEQRLREIGTLRSIGFPAYSVRNLLLREGILVALVGSGFGAIGAIAYGWIMIYGLGTWWVGAVGTTSLRLFVSPTSILIGVAGGVLAAVVCIILTLRVLTRVSPRSLLAGSGTSPSGNARSAAQNSWRHRVVQVMPVILGVAGALLLGAAFGNGISQTAGFFGAGALFLSTLLVYVALWLRRDRRRVLTGQGWWSIVRLGFRNTTYRPGRSVVCIALIGAAAFIIVAVDAFRRDSGIPSFDRKSGTGGYQLIAESILPIVNNLSDAVSSLNLKPADLEGVQFTRFRMRPGDDASCLNLYQPQNPKLLGASQDFIKSGRFAFQSSLATSAEERENPWMLLAGSSADGAIPVIGDANSLTYVLHLKPGDEMVVSGDDGSPIRLRVVAALGDSVLQGELIISEENFIRHFPQRDGFHFFLIETPRARVDAVAVLLEDGLSDFGFDATSTAARLASFHQVENAYLSTFQSLGGLGLLLGTVGLAAVLVRNVIERRRELGLLRAIGFRSSHLTLMILAENLFLLAVGLLVGLVCALIAILPALIERDGGLPARALLLLVLVLVTGLAASTLAVRQALRTPLLPALRNE